MKTKLYAERKSGKFFKHSEETIYGGIYLHGKLEEKNGGYDIVQVPDDINFFKEDRIEDVLVILSSGKRINAKMFLWHSRPHDNPAHDYYESEYMKKDPRFNVHGLIVEKGDRKMMIDAAKHYNERRDGC